LVIKIAIVGSEESKWKTEIQKQKAKTIIDHILANAKLGNKIVFTGTPIQFSDDGKFITSGKGMVIYGGNKEWLSMAGTFLMKLY